MSLTNKVTHCIAATLGTEKTYRASKLGVPVLWQGWFWESVNLWQRQNEKAWLAIPDQTNTQTPGPPPPLYLLKIYEGKRRKGRHLKAMKVLERGGMMKLKLNWMLSWMARLIGDLMLEGESST
jgi:hypothetical protein